MYKVFRYITLSYPYDSKSYKLYAINWFYNENCTSIFLIIDMTDTNKKKFKFSLVEILLPFQIRIVSFGISEFIKNPQIEAFCLTFYFQQWEGYSREELCMMGQEVYFCPGDILRYLLTEVKKTSSSVQGNRVTKARFFCME